MLSLPKLILCEIGYYLSLPDLVKVRSSNSKLNACFGLDYFWQQRTKFDFSYRTGDENNLALYRDLYLGQKIICQNQLMTFKEFREAKSCLINNGKIVIFTYDSEYYNSNYWIYHDNWNKNYEYWLKKVQLGANLVNAVKKKVGFLTKPMTTRINYISPDKLNKWTCKFTIGRRYYWTILPPMSIDFDIFL